VSDTVFIPPERQQVRRRGVFIPPLLIISFVLYLIIAFVFFGGRPGDWANALFSIPMVSGAQWGVSSSDLIITLSIVLLFFEILKSTRTGTASVMEHMVSTLVFVLFLIAFILIGACSSSTFFILMLLSLVDVVAGFSVSITSAGRDVTMGG
jgi:hypothetical protein